MVRLISTGESCLSIDTILTHKNVMIMNDDNNISSLYTFNTFWNTENEQDQIVKLPILLL